MDEYWRYINDGAKWRGKMPPSQQLIPWMAQRNINGLAIYKKKLKSGKTKVTFDKAQKGLAFAIAKSMKKKGIIKRFGYKGSQFFTSVIEDGRVEHLKTDLLNALGEDVAVSLRII
jgi:acetate kinase